MSAVHQFVPTFEPGAIANDALQVQRALQGAGHESEIFAEQSRGGLETTGKLHTDYKRYAKADDTLIYHMAVGSNVADYLNDQSQRLVLRHHNITPVEMYAPWPGSDTRAMTWGRQQLEKLVGRTDLGTGVSEFNRRELEALHYKNTAVSPILFDFDDFDHAVDETFLQQRQQERAGGGADWLFVGWVAPHKCQHDIIKAFALYRKLYDPQARLHLVGRPAVDSYWEACLSLIHELELDGAVHFTGRVSDGHLGVYYRTADVLVCMSEHEGVGIPLLESMFHRVPIVAYAAAAVPETVDGAGVILRNKTPALVAATVARVVSDAALAEKLRDRGAARLPAFSLENSRARLLQLLA